MSTPDRSGRGGATAGLGAVLLAGCLLAGCSSSDAGYCRSRADCPPDLICADGICSEQLVLDARPLPDVTADLPRDAPRWPDLAADASGCRPDDSGAIERDEVPVEVGRSVSYEIGTALVVDLAGVQQSGTTRWDLRAAADDDQRTEVQIEPVFDWARPDFPGATYTTLLATVPTFFIGDLELYGVFSVDQQALRLAGIISRTAQQTELSYAEPVDLLRFPAAVGDHYVTSSALSGVMAYSPWYLFERYTVDVLSRGRLELPALTLDALLVRVAVWQNAGLVETLVGRSEVTYLFITECYGTVARIVAEDDDDLRAVRASERWRLSF